MPMVEGAGVELHVEELGDPGGPRALLVHGMAVTGASLRSVTDALADHRVVLYDRRGYGGSSAPVPYAGTTVEEQGEDAAALLRALGLAPAVVAGAGFGALVALDVAHRHRALVRGVVLAEPPMLHLVGAEATEALAEEQGKINEAVFVGGPRAGAAAWKGEPVADEAVRGFFADYAGLATLGLLRRELRAIDVPATVLTGPGTPPLVRKAAEALAALLPAARRADDGDVAAAVRALG